MSSTFGGKKQRTLAALLAAHSGSAVSTDRCIDALWGDSPPDGAAHSLQTYVSNLRRIVDPEHAGLLETGSGGYRLLVDTDVAAFTAVVSADEPSLRELEGALALWRGRPLGDLGDDEWAQAFVTGWEQLRITATDTVATLRLAAGDPETVVLEMEHAIGEHPYHEAFWAALHDRALSDGSADRSVASVHPVEEGTRDELGIEPSTELVALEERILLHDPSLARPVTTPHNLPAEMSSLVGRNDSIAEVLELLDETRMVTLIGSGGVGKTRLGIAAARAAVGFYPDGVWFVDLARLENGALVLPAIAEALDVEPPALRPLEDAVADAIAGTEILFVLDNCEHLVDAAAEAAATLLRRNPGVRVLATSREALRISGEVAWRVPSLGFPDVGADLESIVESDAVELFIQRARAVDSRFRVTDDDGPAVASVCRHLDGIPLAIELAAARTRSRDIAELDGRLGETFDVLTGGGRDVLPRHRTLRATIEWSYELLDDEAQAFFDQLGVFVGSFTVDAAAAVTNLTFDDAADVIDGLVIRSILQPVAGTHHRFRLLETLRHFALERLGATGRLDDLRTRHLEWVSMFCLSETPKLMGAEPAATIEEIRLALNDIRAGLEWSIVSEPEVGLRTAAALGRFWYLAALQFEGAGWFDRLMAAGPNTTDLEMGRAETAAATTMVRIGRWEEAAAMAKDAVALLEPLDEPVALGWAYYYLGIASVSGDYDNADEVRALWATAQKLMIEAEYRPGIALTTLLIGFADSIRDPAAGAAAASRLIEAAGPRGNPTLVAHALELHGSALIRLGQPTEAAQELRASIEVHRSVDNWACLAHTFTGVSAHLVSIGRELDAARVVGGIDALRLSISTIEAPYERVLVGFYPWEDGIDTKPDLEAARAEGRTWDRDELFAHALEYLHV